MPAETRPTVKDAAPNHSTMISRDGFCGSRPRTDKKKPAGIKMAAQSTPLPSESAQPRHSLGGGHDLDHQAEDDQHPGVSMTRTEERLLQVVRGDAAGHDLQQERAAVGDGDDDEQHDAGSDGIGG